MNKKILIIMVFMLLISFVQSSEIYRQILGTDKTFETSESVFSVKTLNQDLLIDVKKVEIKVNGEVERTLFYLTNENIKLALEKSKKPKKKEESEFIPEIPVVEPVSPEIPGWAG